MFSFIVILQGRSISHSFAFTLNRKEPKQTEERCKLQNKKGGWHWRLSCLNLNCAQHSSKGGKVTLSHFLTNTYAQNHLAARLLPIINSQVYHLQKLFHQLEYAGAWRYASATFLTFSYNPTVCVRRNNGVKTSLTTQNSKELFYNSPFLLHCNAISKCFLCHGESRKRVHRP